MNSSSDRHTQFQTQDCTYKSNNINDELKCFQNNMTDDVLDRNQENQICSSESSSQDAECGEPTMSSIRISSSIKRTGTDGTWMYPSINMFKAAIIKKAEARMKKQEPISDLSENFLKVTDINSLQDETLSAIVHMHNIVNEQAWQQILKYEKLHNCTNPSLTSFHGRPNDLTIKAHLWSLFGYSKPFDRHDWFVDRCGCSSQPNRYIIDFYEGQKKLALKDGQEIYIPSIYLDVRPEPSLNGMLDRFNLFVKGLFS